LKWEERRCEKLGPALVETDDNIPIGLPKRKNVVEGTMETQ